MATYTFETMSSSDAATFTSTDNLIFRDATVSTLGVTDNPGSTTTGPLGTTITAESITLTSAGHSLTFGASALSGATQTGNVLFLNGDSLLVGTSAANTLTLADAGHGHSQAVYGFDGADTILGTSSANDTINGGNGDDVITGSSSYTDASGHFTENDFYQGGGGADSIVGGLGNDHIYGNLFSSAQGSADGNDTISGGAGNDYVNGNAGNDSIDGGDGNDRLYGGNGDDGILGGNGNDYLQGNKGNDSLNGGLGNNILHGGAGNDTLTSGYTAANNHDQLWGDNGNDFITGGNGADTISGGGDFDGMEGGNGNDTFVFGVGDSSIAHLTSDPATDGQHGMTDYIVDFTDGKDHISLGFTVSAIVHGQAGVVPADGTAAETYAQTLLNASSGTHGTEVAAITDSSGGTWLFWNDAHSSATINSAVYLNGVTDDHINVSGNNADFV